MNEENQPLVTNELLSLRNYWSDFKTLGKLMFYLEELQHIPQLDKKKLERGQRVYG